MSIKAKIPVLYPKTLSIDIHTTGGARLTPKDDVLGEMRGVNSDAFNYLMAKYGSDTEALKLLCSDTSHQDRRYYPLYSSVALLAVRQKWKIRGKPKEKLRRLINLCVVESINPPCPSCKGTGEYRYKICNPCKGSGEWRLTDSQRAFAIGVNPNVWKHWKDRQYDVMRLISGLEGDAVSCFYRNILGFTNYRAKEAK